MMQGDPPAFDARTVDPRIRLAMRILEFEQTVPPDGDALAKRVGLSPFHFARQFAAQIGQPAASYSRRIRLDHSINRLRYDATALGKVAAAFGYTSAAAYTRAFARQFGASPREYMKSALAASSSRPPALPDREVAVIRHEPRAAVARRFFGSDWSAHWRSFLHDLPTSLTNGRTRLGMTYDDPRVTPERHRRYDCAVLANSAAEAGDFVRTAVGLDVVEAPGGIHAEMRTTGGIAAIGPAILTLFGSWLPRHPEFQPEGDPLVHRLLDDPWSQDASAVVTIRLHQRAQTPSPNLQPLDRRGRPAGRAAELG